MAFSQIILQNLVLHAYHGVYSQEAQLGTEFKISLFLDVDPEMPGFYNDKIDDAVNYEIVVEHLVHLVSSHRCHLVERLCQIVCEDLIALPGVLKVDISIFKYVKSLPPHPQWIGVRRVLPRSTPLATDRT